MIVGWQGRKGLRGDLTSFLLMGFPAYLTRPPHSGLWCLAPNVGLGSCLPHQATSFWSLVPSSYRRGSYLAYGASDPPPTSPPRHQVPWSPDVGIPGGTLLFSLHGVTRHSRVAFVPKAKLTTLPYPARLGIFEPDLAF